MFFTLICGSISSTSYTRSLLTTLERLLQREGAETLLWDLRTSPLPFADPAYHRDVDSYPNPEVQRYLQAMRDSDGVVLGSPLYHGSFSGVLKNALDHLWYDALRNKPVALVSHGSTDRRCAQPAVALQQVVTTLYGYAIQTQVASAKSDFSLDADGLPQVENGDLLERLTRQSRELLQMASLLKGKDLEKED